MSGNAGIQFIYYWDGDPTDLGLSKIDPPKGAVIVDLTTPQIWLKLSAKGDNSAYMACGGLSVVTKTDDHTLVLGDANRYIRMNKGTAVNLTVPPNASVAFPIGTQIVIRNAGAGQVTVVAGSGVTITSSSTLLLRAQHSSASIVKTATNTWELAGDLQA